MPGSARSTRSDNRFVYKVMTLKIARTVLFVLVFLVYSAHSDDIYAGRLNRLKALMDESFIDYSDFITRNDPTGSRAQFLYRRYLNFKEDYDKLKDAGELAPDMVDYGKIFTENIGELRGATDIQNLIGTEPSTEAHKQLGWYLFHKEYYSLAERLFALISYELAKENQTDPLVEWALGYMEVKKAGESIDYKAVESLQVRVLSRVLAILESHDIELKSEEGIPSLKEAAERLMEDAKNLL